MSFIMDIPLMMLGGLGIVYACNRFFFRITQGRRYPLYVLTAVFFFWFYFIAVYGLYLDNLNLPITTMSGGKYIGGGNYFMWNSALEIFGIGPFVESVPTYADPFGALNLFAIFIFTVAYPFSYWVGIQLGYIMFGRNERQQGAIALMYPPGFSP